MSRTLHRLLTVFATTLAVACALPGCAVVSVAGTAVGVAASVGSAALSVGSAAVSVGSTVVGTTAKVAGRAVEATVAPAAPSPAAPR